MAVTLDKFPHTWKINEDLMRVHYEGGCDLAINFVRKEYPAEEVVKLVQRITTQTFTCPSIARIYCLVENAGRLAIVTDFMRRGSLYDVMSTGEEFSQTEKMKAIYGIAAAIDWLANNDYHPENISLNKWLVGDNNELCVASFLVCERKATDDGTMLCGANHKSKERMKDTDLLYIFASLAYAIITWTVDQKKLKRPPSGTFPKFVTEHLQSLLRMCWGIEGRGKPPTFQSVVTLLENPDLWLPEVNQEEFVEYAKRTMGDGFVVPDGETLMMDAAMEPLTIIGELIPIFRLKERVLEGNISAMLSLGRRYEFGYSVRGGRNPVTALNYFRKAANLDSAEGHYEYGRMRLVGGAEIYDADKAVRHLQRSAHMGFPQAMVLYGDCLDGGLGGDWSRAGCAKWFKRAADLGYVWGECKYGIALATGRGVPTNFEQAVVWLKKAVEKKNYRAMAAFGDLLQLGHGVIKNMRLAATLYWEASCRGISQGLVGFASLRMTGEGGVRRDGKAAFKMLSQAHKKGLVDAAFHLSTCYRDGIGTDVDLVKAKELLEHAAGLGYVRAFVELGSMYTEGKMVEIDLRKAFHMYQIAAQRGSGVGMVQLGLMTEKGIIGKPDAPQAVSLYRTANEMGVTEGYYHYGRVIVNGIGCKKNVKAGTPFLQKAVQLGSSDAMLLLRQIDPKLAKLPLDLMKMINDGEEQEATTREKEEADETSKLLEGVLKSVRIGTGRRDCASGRQSGREEAGISPLAEGGEGSPLQEGDGEIAIYEGEEEEEEEVLVEAGQNAQAV